jgi:Flp pilus assembly pilin Flp
MNTRHRIDAREKGQMTIEYAVMFVAITAVVIYAATHFIQPSVNRFFNGTAKIINKSVEEIENRFS